MTENDELKKVEKELNTDKKQFVADVISNQVQAVAKLAEKTKDKNTASQLVKTAQETHKYIAEIPDIKITTGVESKSIKILYPLIGTKPFKQGSPIDVVFETHGVKTPFIYGIFAHSEKENKQYNLYLSRSNNQHVDKKNIRDGNTTPLNAGGYKLIVGIIERRQPGSKETQFMIDPVSGKPVIDAVPIIIEPSTTTPPPNSPITIIRPRPEEKISVNGPLTIEFTTTAKPPFHYGINIPNNGGLVYKSKEVTSNHISEVFTLDRLDLSASQTLASEKPKKQLKIKAIKNQRIDIIIFHPADPKSVPVNPMASVNVDFV